MDQFQYFLNETLIQFFIYLLASTLVYLLVSSGAAKMRFSALAWNCNTRSMRNNWSAIHYPGIV